MTDMTDTPFNADEEARLYEELGLSPDAIFAQTKHDDEEEVPEWPLPSKEEQVEWPTQPAVEEPDERPNPASSIVVQVPDVSTVEFDDALIEHLDMNDHTQRAEASRILFTKYGGSAYGIPKGTHRSNWNALIHQRISMHLGRRKAAAGQVDRDSLRSQVSEASSQKVADTAAISTQAALKVLKSQILGEDGQIDLNRFAQLLKEA